MYFDIRTDLACEMYEKSEAEKWGAEWHDEEHEGVKITRLRIRNEEAERAYQKPCGEYVTLDCGKLHLLSPSAYRVTRSLLVRELRRMVSHVTSKRIDGSFCVLIVGLGNASLTADAIGPATVKRLTATRHLKTHDQGLFRSLECSALCALAPGVIGQTGIETQEIIKGVVRLVQPDLLIAVDALAARSCARLSCTVQLSDCGISPGSGVGNHRAELSSKTLGTPVIALGVPTVVNSSTLVLDALQTAGIEQIDRRLQAVLDNGTGFFVTPKDSDVITQTFAALLADAIGSVFAPQVP